MLARGCAESSASLGGLPQPAQQHARMRRAKRLQHPRSVLGQTSRYPRSHKLRKQCNLQVSILDVVVVSIRALCQIRWLRGYGAGTQNGQNRDGQIEQLNGAKGLLHRCRYERQQQYTYFGGFVVLVVE